LSASSHEYQLPAQQGAGLRVETREIGVVEVVEKQVLEFVLPILGFESHRRFVILPDPKAKPFHWLQSLEDKGVAFPVVSMEEFQVAYRFDPGLLAQLGVSQLDRVDVWIIVMVPRDGSGMRVNLRAPVVVNQRTGRAGQMVVREEYPVSGPLRSVVGNART